MSGLVSFLCSQNLLIMWKDKIENAHKLIGEEIRYTPLEYSAFISKLTGSEVYLKLENYQLSGSFKIRGVMNKVLRLTEKETDAGLVACSTGNHGAAFAHAMDKFGYHGILFLPNNVSKAKLEAIKHYKVDLQFYGDDCVVTEAYARNYAEEHGHTLVHPYNDEEVICGQGTIGHEISQQLNGLPDVVIAPVGGGGLIAGLGAYFKSNGSTEVIGCQPVNSAVMFESLKAGEILELESKETLADATAGGVEQDSITFEMCRDFVDDIYLATEDEICSAINLIVENHQMIVEGAAAMTIASLLNQTNQFKGKNVVLILSGRKLSLHDLEKSLKR